METGTTPKPRMLLSLQTLIEHRRSFQELYVYKRYGKPLVHLTVEERNAILKDLIFAGVTEMIEFLEKATNWKDHRPTHEINRAAALEEFVDAFNFMLTPFIYMDISVEEFFAAFRKKGQIVMDRFVDEFPQVVNAVAASQEKDKRLHRIGSWDDGFGGDRP